MWAESPRLARWLALAVFGVAPLAVGVVLRFGFDPVAWEAGRPLVHRQDDYVGSNACQSCHPEQHASWTRTFHRTMTQRASPDTIVGAFDGRAVSYQGRSARPFRDGDRYYIELPADGGGTWTAEVVLAVGSRRYQQYFEREDRGDGFVFVRLPILWHIEARRWLHINTVFLRPDDSDWTLHRTRWNDNCIFCHNTGPKPGELDFFSTFAQDARRFDSHVAELGIACETCHGPGAGHAALYREPVARYQGYLSGENDPRIMHPEKLEQERAVSICGQCHGQRLPPDNVHLVRWLTDGPTFRSGDRLPDHVRPVTRETPPPGNLPDLFRLRFWADGTARLTAYEYQGVVMSPCYQRGPMTCESCHEMHGGDPRGMIEPAMRGNSACIQCHGEIARDIRGHTHHDPERSGSACMECHMPRMVYGILEIHRSHRIENPDPARDGKNGRPHACTTCHLDQSLLWAADRMAEWWGEQYRRPASRLDGAPLELADSLASLLAGDAVQRAVYAWAAGRPDTPLEPRDKLFLRGALTATLADGYPNIRWLARRSLLALEDELSLGLRGLLAGWDHMDAAGRTDFAYLALDELALRAPERLRPAAPGMLMNDYSPDLESMVRLMDLQQDRVISIGE